MKRASTSTSNLSGDKRQNAHAIGVKIRDEDTFAGASRRAMSLSEMTRQAEEDRKRATGYKATEPGIPNFGSFWAGLQGDSIPEPAEIVSFFLG